MDENINKIVKSISASRKYRNLYHPLVERICKEEYFKFKNEGDRVKAIKTKLHLLYGSYINETAVQKAEKLIGGDNAAILRLHASTRERLPHLFEFYGFIFDAAVEAETILDVGCGFNPFTLPYMPKKIKNYFACDVDAAASELFNRYFNSIGLPPSAYCEDIIVATPRERADIAFCFKLLPVLETQAKGRGLSLLLELNVKLIAVTFPLKTLCGKNSSFGINYDNYFQKLIGDSAGKLTVADKKTIGDELVYIVKKSEG